jgi:hypothetical protein
MSNENHPCGSLAASFEIIVFDFEIRKRDQNNECAFLPSAVQKSEK